jgi:hypothetical protein
MVAVIEKTRLQEMEGHKMQLVGSVFSDPLVTATELNRRCGAILDMALRKPVTITRNDQSFALLRRELVAQLSAAYEQFSMFLDISRSISLVQTGKKLNKDNHYQWLNVYEANDLALFYNELTEALADVINGDDLYAIENLVHEWHESAIAVESDVLSKAFEADSDPVDLTPPSNERGEVDE